MYRVSNPANLIVLLTTILFFAAPAMALDSSQPPSSDSGPFGKETPKSDSSSSITLKLAYKPSRKAKPNPRPVVVLPFKDKRASQASIGYRTAAFGVDMGKVYADQPVTDFVRTALVKELAAKGYTASSSGHFPQVSGELYSFWVKTNTTPLYWEVEATVWATVTTSCPGSTDQTKAKTYEVTKKRTTFVWPSQSLIEKLFQKVMAELMKQATGDITKSLSACNENSR